MERTDRSYSERGFNVSCVSDLSGVSPIGTVESSEWRSLQASGCLVCPRIGPWDIKNTMRTQNTRARGRKRRLWGIRLKSLSPEVWFKALRNAEASCCSVRAGSRARGFSEQYLAAEPHWAVVASGEPGLAPLPPLWAAEVSRVLQISVPWCCFTSNQKWQRWLCKPRWLPGG